MADAQAIAVNKINELIKILPKPVSEQLTAAEKASGQTKVVIISAVLGLALVLLFLLIPAQLMLDLVGAGYPLYACLLMLATDKMADAKYWITYWVLFVGLRIFLALFDFILSFIPLIFYVKCGLFVYLYSPMTRGVDQVTDLLLKPFVFPLITGVAYVPEVKAKATDEKTETKKTVNKEMQEVVAGLLSKDSEEKKEE